MKFTVEREKDMCLAFLDSNVHRSIDGSLKRDIYGKPTHRDKHVPSL